jgi:hypothetical protein
MQPARAAAAPPGGPLLRRQAFALHALYAPGGVWTGAPSLLLLGYACDLARAFRPPSGLDDAAALVAASARASADAGRGGADGGSACWCARVPAGAGLPPTAAQVSAARLWQAGVVVHAGPARHLGNCWLVGSGSRPVLPSDELGFDTHGSSARSGTNLAGGEQCNPRGPATSFLNHCAPSPLLPSHPRGRRHVHIVQAPRRIPAATAKPAATGCMWPRSPVPSAAVAGRPCPAEGPVAWCSWGKRAW